MHGVQALTGMVPFVSGYTRFGKLFVGMANGMGIPRHRMHVRQGVGWFLDGSTPI